MVARAIRKLAVTCAVLLTCGLVAQPAGAHEGRPGKKTTGATVLKPLQRTPSTAGSSASPFASVSGALRSGFDQYLLPGNDDGSTTAVQLPFSVTYYGRHYTSIFVNNNGNVTFGQALGDYTPQSLDRLGVPIIAPFWADVDTRGGNPVTFGTGAVNGHQTFGVNWLSVGCYSEIETTHNSFQLLLISRADLGPGNFDIEFNYGAIHWETGQASGGDQNCLGGISARGGYGSGKGSAYQLPGSGIDGAFLDSNPVTGLIHHSFASGVLGRYDYHATSVGVSGASYVALGDSYSSGEGTGQYDYSLSNNPHDSCDRGPLAWPVRMSQLFPAAPHINGAKDFFACSGATSYDLFHTVPVGEPDTQLHQLQDWVQENGPPGLVTVTIAGNDLNFHDVVVQCYVVGALACVPTLDNVINKLSSASETSVLASTSSRLHPRRTLTTSLRSATRTSCRRPLSGTTYMPTCTAHGSTATLPKSLLAFNRPRSFSTPPR